MKIMREADVIFYIDDGFETFLNQAFSVLPDDVHKISIAHKS